MNFLRRNFPQIQMHGGTAAVDNIDHETGTVTVRLGGACSGCGISPMTVNAIKSRMVKEISEVEEVEAVTGEVPPEGMGAAAEGEVSDEGPEAPF